MHTQDSFFHSWEPSAKVFLTTLYHDRALHLRQGVGIMTWKSWTGECTGASARKMDQVKLVWWQSLLSWMQQELFHVKKNVNCGVTPAIDLHHKCSRLEPLNTYLRDHIPNFSLVVYHHQPLFSEQRSLITCSMISKEQIWCPKVFLQRGKQNTSKVVASNEQTRT